MTRAPAPLTIGPAALDTISPLLLATALDRERRGQPLWEQDSLTPAALAHAYPGAQGHAAFLGERAVGAMLLVLTDAVFWPGDPPGEALYLHKLAVLPEWQGRGLAHALLEAAVTLTREAGRPFLRLDTAAERPQLRAVYDTFGFRLVREGRCGPYESAWYELRV